MYSNLNIQNPPYGHWVGQALLSLLRELGLWLLRSTLPCNRLIQPTIVLLYLYYNIRWCAFRTLIQSNRLNKFQAKYIGCASELWVTMSMYEMTSHASHIVTNTHQSLSHLNRLFFLLFFAMSASCLIGLPCKKECGTDNDCHYTNNYTHDTFLLSLLLLSVCFIVPIL